MIGYYYDQLGNRNSAIVYYELALSYYRSFKSYIDMVEMLLELSVLYLSEFDLDKGISYADKALFISENQNLSEQLIKASTVLGLPMVMIGIPEKAIPYFELALKKLHTFTLDEENYNVEDYNYDNSILQLLLGISYAQLGDRERAFQYFEEGLLFANKIENDDALINFCKGYFFSIKLNFDEALKYFKKTIRDPKISTTWVSLAPITYNQIGGIYLLKEDYQKSFEYIMKSLSISTKNKIYVSQIESLIHLTSLSMIKNESDKSIEYLTYLVGIIEEQLQYATTEYRIDLFENLLIYYEWLTMYQILDDNYHLAIETLELSKYKQLKEQLGLVGDKLSEKEFDFTNIDITENEVIVSFDLINESKQSLYKTSKTLYGENNPFFDVLEIQDKETNYDLLLTTVVYKENESLMYYYNISVKDTLIFNDNMPDLSIMVKLYRYYLKFDRKKAYELSKTIYDYLIEPVKPIIENYTRLIVIPDPVISGLPFETLVDDEENYLIDKYDITYIQSYSILNILQKREYRNKRKPLLAFGGAVYNSIDEDSIYIEGISVDELEKTIYDRITSRGSLRAAYTSLGYSNWSNLPGSYNEVVHLSQVIDNTDIITMDKVTENKIKELSKIGDLSNYRMIHFAMHGVVIPERPELSALVFSQFKNELNDEDGFLRMGEIAELDIQADFINLSACETGLGKVYSSEGIIGLTQAFMVAGANSVSVTLWPVADEATSTFMTSVYTKISEGIPYSLAIIKTKREFISGVYGEEYKDPFYWAPFVYYGK